MPALIPTDFTATVTWLGRVGDRDASLRARPAEHLDLSFAGPKGEAHGGATRPACSRVSAQHPRGTTIRNVRQLSVLADEDLVGIAKTMGLAQLDPAWLGASLVLRGIPDFSHLPPSSRLQGPDGVTIVIDMENRPCLFPAKVIEGEVPGAGARFKPAAQGRRGVTAWVEREGVLRLGDVMRLHVPDQPVWAHLAEARGSVLAE